ncbi:MAG: ATP-dependent RNA helicase HrpA [Phycisphaerales bacterium]|nr:ATP-dependent RNA helicase HrpA [Phycisphaerales bacterium]
MTLESQQLPGAVRADLPVGARAREITESLRRNRALIVVGETGSGKSTQLPRICLAVAGAKVLQTQPRRIAARSIATRIAEESGTALGTLVGYRTRFDRCISRQCLIEVVTDGLLLARMRDDPLLRGTSTVIVDEAHERSLNIDFLLGCLRRLLERRDDLRIVVSSATIEAGKFSDFLGGCPVLEVAGRTHQVDIRYRPATEDAGESPALADQVCRAVEECVTEPDCPLVMVQAHGEGEGTSSAPGEDVLVFLPGEREIMETAEVLTGRFGQSLEILPLHSRLPAAAQDRLFASSPLRRVVLATNIAETSLTVPRVRFVVDSGLARIARYSTKSRIQRLPIEPVAQASARQRAGRCGRLGPGICLRLYSEADLAARPEFVLPEIRRTSLAGALMQMKSLHLGEPEKFPFIDAPSSRAIAEAEQTLFEIGATAQNGRLTPCGHRLAGLNLDPRLAKLVDASQQEGCPQAGLVVASFLSVQDPRERPAADSAAADFAHAQFRDAKSDAGGVLRLWEAWKTAGETLGSSVLRRWCRERFLSHRLLREWADVYSQLARATRERSGSAGAGIETNESLLASDGLHRALLASFICNAAMRTEKGTYKSVSGAEFVIHPSSALASACGHWLVAAEIVETTRRFARFVTRISPAWIERVASHMITRSVSEPHWVERSGQVAAWERISCGALTLIPRRLCPYGPSDPAGARDLFIQGALVEERVVEPASFMLDNRALRHRLADESAILRRDCAMGVEAIQRFYDGRVPQEIHSWPSLLSWIRSDPTHESRLRMQEHDLRAEGVSLVDHARFPSSLRARGTTLALQYRHQPGDEMDGPSIQVPIWAVPVFDGRALEWLVPGLLPEKLEALIRALPKRARVRFQPALEFAAGAAESLGDTEGDLLNRLAEYLSRVGEIEIARSDFQLAGLPAHLRMRIEIIGPDQEVLACGRDWAAVAAAVTKEGEAAFALECRRAFAPTWLAESVLEFPSEGISSSLGSESIAPGIVFPALAARGESVDRVVVARSADVAPLTEEAAAVLFVRAHHDAIRLQVENHPHWPECGLLGADLGGSRHALAVIKRAIGTAAMRGQGPLRTRGEFDARSADASSRLWQMIHESVQHLHGALAGRLRVISKLEEPVSPALAPTWAAVRAHLDQLWAPPRFVHDVDLTLSSIGRWTAALAARLRKAAERGGEWDMEHSQVRASFEIALSEMTTTAAGPARLQELDVLQRMLEEYSVWLYAQDLGTRTTVSAQKLERCFAAAAVRYHY